MNPEQYPGKAGRGRDGDIAGRTLAASSGVPRGRLLAQHRLRPAAHAHGTKPARAGGRARRGPAHRGRDRRRGCHHRRPGSRSATLHRGWPGVTGSSARGPCRLTALASLSVRSPPSAWTRNCCTWDSTPTARSRYHRWKRVPGEAAWYGSSGDASAKSGHGSSKVASTVFKGPLSFSASGPPAWNIGLRDARQRDHRSFPRHGRPRVR